MKRLISIIVTLWLFICGINGYAYTIPAHKKIVVEAAKVWKDIPQEIRDHLTSNNKLDKPCRAGYDAGDDIYSGSGEEDNENNFVSCFIQGTLFEHTDDNEGRNGFLEHFWDPDYSELTPAKIAQRPYNCLDAGGLYNLGLPNILEHIFPSCGDHFDSGYRLAQDYWDNKVIPLYRKGSVDESYYWLGRIAHLLSDAGVPAHMHNIPHDPIIASKDLYETFVTTSVLKKYPGENFSGEEYNPDACSARLLAFDWSMVHPHPTRLFKLFWCVAQKTQYFASQNQRSGFGSIGNNFYVDLSGNPHVFTPSLWEDESEPISDPSELTGKKKVVNKKLRQMADVLVPHALKAVAGLYRLFWEEAHSRECPDSLGLQGTISYLCFLEGDPGIPGDGISVSTGEEFAKLKFAPKFSLRGATDGFTLSLFPETILPESDAWKIHVLWSAIDLPGCDIEAATGKSAVLTPVVNGVQGYSFIYPQIYLKLTLEFLQSISGCQSLTLNELAIDGATLFSFDFLGEDGFPPLRVRELDAVAIGNGVNVSH